jgi:N-acetylmuramoyl-L-alanine amidase
MEPQIVTGIILHNTGVRKKPNASLENKMRALQDFSQHPGQVSPGHWKPAWPDVPYHFYVDAHGRIAEGRSIKYAGDTNTSYRTSGFIQIVVEGDFEHEDPAPDQLNAVRDLLAWVLASQSLPIESISVHKDHAPTDCPGANFMAVLPRLLDQVSHKLRSASI